MVDRGGWLDAEHEREQLGDRVEVDDYRGDVLDALHLDEPVTTTVGSEPRRLSPGRRSSASSSMRPNVSRGA